MLFFAINAFLTLHLFCLSSIHATTIHTTSTRTVDITPSPTVLPPGLIYYTNTALWLGQPSAGNPLPSVGTLEFATMSTRECLVFSLAALRLAFRRQRRLHDLTTQMLERLDLSFSMGVTVYVAGRHLLLNRFREYQRDGRRHRALAHRGALRAARHASDAKEAISRGDPHQAAISADSCWRYADDTKYEVDWFADVLGTTLDSFRMFRGAEFVPLPDDEVAIWANEHSPTIPGLSREHLPSDFAFIEAWARLRVFEIFELGPAVI